MEMRLREEVGLLPDNGLFFVVTLNRNNSFFPDRKVLVTVFLSLASTVCVPAQYLNVIGVTLLRATTTNLDGSGIRVAQVEAGYGAAVYWQVNPNVAVQPTNLFIYVYSNATSSTFPNSLGAESGHANDVASQFYCQTNGVATNVAQVYNYEANDFVNNYVFSSPTHSANATVVNESFTFGEQTVASQQSIDSGYDNYSLAYNTLFVSPANNYGTSGSATTNVVPPGTAYNCICVGAYKNGGSYNSLGPTLDNGRCKPDITAMSDATSYSTPEVSGAAAVMMQAARRGDGGSDTNSAADLRTIKALLLNGALKPADWTNSNSSPLDARYGAGVLNLFNSYKQLAAGKYSFSISNSVSPNAAHPPTGTTSTISSLVGWNFTTNVSGKSHSPSAQFDTIHHYYFNGSNNASTATFTATATLAWNRQFGETNINDLDLFLYNCANSNLVACSTSRVDNVEHLYVTNLAPGRYDLQVWKAGGSNIVSAAEPYALAWQFVPPPTLTISGGATPALAWPVYPAGFLVEAETNLLGGAWSANNLPSSVITNGQNSIPLNPTNAMQFFRLRSPNF
jgi:hypothetical protein